MIIKLDWAHLYLQLDLTVLYFGLDFDCPVHLICHRWAKKRKPIINSAWKWNWIDWSIRSSKCIVKVVLWCAINVIMTLAKRYGNLLSHCIGYNGSEEFVIEICKEKTLGLVHKKELVHRMQISRQLKYGLLCGLKVVMWCGKAGHIRKENFNQQKSSS